MAFNPFVTFQKNRRFWMAAILMICMVSFVFCTGLKGDMGDRLSMIFGRGGPTAFTLDGRTYTNQQVHQLRDQRNLANKLMMNCADMSFKKLSKLIYDLEKGVDANKPEELKARQKKRVELEHYRIQLGFRKSRPRYFEIGVKFDDLVEFATWQIMADKMGIHLEDQHVTLLFYSEIFGVLDSIEIERAESLTRQEFRDVNHAYIRRAIAEEFRVRIAQEAYLQSRPVAYYFGGRQEGLGQRLIRPEVPDQTRAPLTPAQLWDLYKKHRAEFSVDLLPIDVLEFVKNVKDAPTEDDKAKYYTSAKNRPTDPASDQPGLQLPSRVKLKYLYADATSPAYLESAKLTTKLKLMSPVAIDAAFSPLTALVRYEALDKIHRMELEKQYDDITRVTDKFDYRTSAPGAGDFNSPLMMWFARREWEAAVSLLSPTPPTTLDSLAPLFMYMHWGAVKHPEELQIAQQAEVKRRAPLFASLVGTTLADPLTALGADFCLNYVTGPTGDVAPRYQPFPAQVAFRELEERALRRSAEERAQENMQAARVALEKAEGDAEKIKRELNRIVTELKLTVGPEGDKEGKWYDRYNIDELETLKTAYLRYIDAINMFEARDLTPEKLLKSGDFYKMFFDSSESFSASALHRPMPWPPVVTRPNNQRIFGGVENAKLIDQSKIENVLREQFNNFVGQNNPLAPLPAFDGLFRNAEKPILFWRTAKRDPRPLPADYGKIADELKRIDEAYKSAETNIQSQLKLIEEIEPLRAAIKKVKTDPQAAEAAKKKFNPLNDKLKRLENEAGGTVTFLRLKQADLKEDEADLKRVQEDVVKGWKFEQARTKALPAAEEAAISLIEGKDTLVKHAEKFNAKLFTIPHLSRMHPETVTTNRDYGKPPLPKDKVAYPRDDMIDQALELFDPKGPVKVGNKELDEINQKLFDLVKKSKKENARGNFVQILTNKPRTAFYIAQVPLAPKASQEDFFLAMKLGSFTPPGENEERFRMVTYRYSMDQFIERVQQQEGKLYRASVIDGLQRQMSLDVTDKARKDFDEKVSD